MSKYNKLHESTDINLHKKVQTKNKPVRHILELIPGRIISIDLIDMSKQPDKNNKYILNAIDIFTKKAWAYPMKTKNASEIKKVLETLFTEIKPDKIWADEEAAFKSDVIQKLLTKNNIHLYHSYGKHKACIIERFNRTMKEQMHKAHGDGKKMKNWTPFIKKFIKYYNKTPHSSLLNFSPEEVAISKEKQCMVRINNVNNFTHFNPKQKNTLAIGQRVHIRRKKDTFEKGYTKTFTDDIFTVDIVNNTKPITYRLRDQNNKLIKNSFYASELMKA